MGKRATYSTGTIREVSRLLKETRDMEVLRRAQAIYCRAALGMAASEIAGLTGYSVGTVRNLHSAFARDGMKALEVSRRGGRNNADMSEAEEKAFLAPFRKEGDAGGILEIGAIHRAHCKRVGREVALSTTYDLLHRHGWRKIAPKPRHPKADKAAQAAFKKMA